jgi:aspartyl-tRNA(Asn)/glutamyl-tRNA(Gln) amidotransferase subunit C
MITTEEIKKLAKLVKLSFTENELSSFQKQLTSIMDMIDELNEVDCTNVEPLTSVCNMTQRVRKDAINALDISEELFTNVPGESAEFAKEIKCFIVPKVVE